MNGSIYTVSLKDGKVLYVGQTRQKPEARWRQHARGRTKLSEMLRLFGPEDYFSYAVVEEVPLADLDRRERHWIALCGTEAPNGLNFTPGGSNNAHRPESIAKMAAAKRITCADPEYKAKVSEIRKRLWQDPDYRAKVIRRAKEAKATPEHKVKISAIKEEMWKCPERKRSLSEKTRAQWQDPVQRELKSQRIREARRAQMADPDQAAAIKAKLLATLSRKKTQS